MKLLIINYQDFVVIYEFLNLLIQKKVYIYFHCDFMWLKYEVNILKFIMILFKNIS